MEIIVAFEKILKHFDYIEKNEFSTFIPKYYLRYEFDNNNLTDVEAKMSNHKICFSTKINKNEYIGILTLIFEQIMIVAELFQNCYEKNNFDDFDTFKNNEKNDNQNNNENDNFIFDFFNDLIDYQALIVNVLHCDKIEVINILNKFKINKNDIIDYDVSLDGKNKLNYLFLKANSEELVSIFYESFYDNDFSQLKQKKIVNLQKKNQIKIYQIEDLLNLINEFKINLWEKNNNEYYFKNLYYFLPDYIINDRKNVFKELIEKAWHPNRFRKWCLDIDEVKELF